MTLSLFRLVLCCSVLLSVFGTTEGDETTAAADSNQKSSTHKSLVWLTSPRKDRYESVDVEWCRQRPTWRDANDKDAYTKCQKLLGFTPNPNFLTRYMDIEELHHHMLSSTFDPLNRGHLPHPRAEQATESFESYHKFPVMERPLLKTLSACMDDIILAESETTSRESTGKMKQSYVSRLGRRQDGQAVMGIVEEALNEEEARAVLAMSTCIRKHVPAIFEHRDFPGGGGNECVYLTGFLQLLVPGAALRIQTTAKLVWETAGWDKIEDSFEPTDVANWRMNHVMDAEDPNNPNTTTIDFSKQPESNYPTRLYPDPVLETGIRTSEHLTYDKFRALGYHGDGGSEYTVLIALANPQDYEGGVYTLCPENTKTCENKISVKPNRLSAVVFLSETEHGVTDIKSPGRVMMANELWRYGDAPTTTLRPEVAEFVLGVEDGKFFEDHYENYFPNAKDEEDDDDDVDRFPGHEEEYDDFDDDDDGYFDDDYDIDDIDTEMD